MSNTLLTNVDNLQGDDFAGHSDESGTKFPAEKARL